MKRSRRESFEMVRMASNDQKYLVCFIVGFTGEVGKELVKECFRSKKFSRILLLGRRIVPLPPEMDGVCEQHIVDFENLDASAELFRDVDVGYCCLGTTRSKSGKEGFVKVDHDYTMNVAEIAKANGVSQFHYVSSLGADKKSWFMYPRIKGQVENNLSNMGFKSLNIYRPAVLVCDREEERPVEKIFLKTVVKPIASLAPTLIATPTDLLSHVIVKCTNIHENNASAPITILNNKDIYHSAEGTFLR